METPKEQTQRQLAPFHLRRRWFNIRNFQRAFIVILIMVVVTGWHYYRSHVYSVDRVIDGDTFVIYYAGQERRVQLAGADAPEIHKDEPFALQAKHVLERKLLGQQVWLKFLDPGEPLDYKNRLLCWAWYGGENLSYTLVRDGLAKFSGAAEDVHRQTLISLQEEARLFGRGVWAEGLSKPILVGRPAD